MESHPYHHRHHHVPQQHHSSSTGTTPADAAGDGRFPPWSIQETRDFLVIRAELDQAFMETKRNKLLWEVISTKMRERGYNRNAEQCKCKWKNLVTRYKGCETMESEEMRQQFMYYNELQTIFAARIQRMLWMEAAEGGAPGGPSKRNKPGTQLMSSDEEEDNNDHEDSTDRGDQKAKRKKKLLQNKSGSSNFDCLKEVLEEFMQHQMQMETQWLKAYEARGEERRAKEMEWRQAMEALEKERVLMERRWREREEERTMREEARAEKRDALVTALLNKLRREEE